MENGDFALDIECSKGTYIRSLCADIGAALGCGACMSALRRTYSGGFRVEDALALEEIELRGVESCLLPADTLFSDRPALRLAAAREEKAVRNGTDIPAPPGDSGRGSEGLRRGRRIPDARRGKGRRFAHDKEFFRGLSYGGYKKSYSPWFF